MRRTATILGLAALAAVLAGCADDRPAEGGGADVARWQGELPVAGPWLRGRLPAGVLAYARIPHPLGLVAVPKGNTLDAALGSEANIRNLVEIERGLADNVLGAYPLFDDPRLALLLDGLRSPIEVAVFGLPSPSALIAATLDVASAAELEESLAALAAVEPFVGLAGPFGDDGVGALAGLPVPAFLSFDASSGQLLISAGQNVTEASFRQALDGLPSGEDHAMHALEQRIDASGQGLFVWVDTGSVLPLAQMFAPPETAAAVRQAGLDALRSVAFGVGTSAGKGRLSLLLDVGADNPARPLPVVANTLTATAVGEPDAAFLLSIPSAEELARLEALALGAAPAGASGWQEAKAGLAELVGVELEQVLAAFGPELVVILDEAGDYAAVRVRDAAAYEDVVERISAAAGEPVVEREVAGRAFHTWRPPSLLAGARDDEAGAGDVAELLGRMRDRWYWVRDGDYAYFSNLPQPLIDRVRSGADTELGEWLARTQRVDWSSALLAATASVDKLPRRIYHVYIGMMQSLADFAGVDYDIWSMPSADQLGLPSKGAIGASLSMGEPYVSLELTYESQPGELLLGAGGFGSVAAIGILAAVAVPAYQDYAVRAGVAAGLAQAQAARQRVAEHYASAGRFPNADEAGRLAPEAVIPPVDSIAVGPGTGDVVVYFAPGAVPDGGQLWLQPEVGSDGTLTWVCGGSIAQRHLPAACR